MSWNNWLTVFVGVLLILSPWIWGFSDLKVVTWHNLLAGVLTLLFSLWNFNS